MKPQVFMTRSGKIVVGKPDYWNITTLTDKLPNTPILPWNHCYPTETTTDKMTVAMKVITPDRERPQFKAADTECHGVRCSCGMGKVDRSPGSKLDDRGPGGLGKEQK